MLKWNKAGKRKKENETSRKRGEKSGKCNEKMSYNPERIRRSILEVVLNVNLRKNLILAVTGSMAQLK